MRALILLLALCGVASAAELTEVQSRGIMAVAYGQFHGPRTLLDDPPAIHIVSQAELQERFECAPRCPVIHGMYDDAEVAIYLWEALDFSTVYASSVLLHEYVHHFQ